MNIPSVLVIDDDPNNFDVIAALLNDRDYSDTSQIGLGLAFCKMVVEAHGGEIGVTNNQSQGAIFEIILPISS
uniref:ATP-binding protein n=1 Tax=Okeania sp. SIO2F4 TaxID=2607790 RepID=UPI0025FDA7F1|nr:ATP-binding protein [Okeania sp. SIO2F4]